MSKRNLIALCACACAALTISACNESVEYSAQVPICGNGVIETGEICDVSIPATVTCSDFDNTKSWSSGAPGCSADCKLSQGTCTLPITNNCGNGVVDSGETCDGTNFNGKTCADYVPGSTGALSCNSCAVSTTGCVVENKCGNGVLDVGEECEDGVEINSSCEALKGADWSGTLSCSNCMIDSSACVQSSEPACGNGVLDAGEECDPALEISNSCAEEYPTLYSDGSLSCTSECQFDKSSCVDILVNDNCGNGVLDEGEDCDPASSEVPEDNYECAAHDSAKYSDGTYSCSNTCKWDFSTCKDILVGGCGDGVIDETAGEECEEGIEIGSDCAGLKGEGWSGSLICKSCRIDDSACVQTSEPTCGNGILDEGEDCDPASSEVPADNFQCAVHDPSKYSEGTYSCSSECKWNFDTCTDIVVGGCGDGVIDETAGEECEEGIEIGNDCAGLKGDGWSGALSCKNCKIDAGACVQSSEPACGNGILDEGEKCDYAMEGADLSCASLDPSLYYDGTYTCTKGCSIDITACTAVEDVNITYDYAVDFNGLKKNTKYSSFGPYDYKVDKVKIASYSGVGAINNNTKVGYYDDFGGYAVTFTGKAGVDSHVLISSIEGGVKDFAFDYKKWTKSEGISTVQILVDDEVVLDDIKLNSSDLATIKYKVNKEDAKSIKVMVKDPQESSNGKRVAVSNFRWTKF